MAAPGVGITVENWAESWVEARECLGITNLSTFPLVPAPDKDGLPQQRPLTTQEAGNWINLIVAQYFSPVDVRYFIR